MRSSFRILYGAALLSAVLAVPSLAQQAWRVTEHPVLRIGVMEGDPNYQLNHITGALRLSDGRIVIANDYQLRFYDANGRHLRTVGGRGDGPGEFRTLEITLGRGDTILAWDNLRFRLTRFDSQGNRSSIQTYEKPASPDGLGTERSKLLADGSVIMTFFRTSTSSAVSRGLNRTPMRFGRFDPESNRLVMLGGTYGGLRSQAFDLGGGRGATYVTQPFTPHVVHAASSDRFYITDGEAFPIEVYGFDGRRQTQYTSATRRPLPVTRAQHALFFPRAGG
jgi:hypothetical protein